METMNELEIRELGKKSFYIKLNPTDVYKKMFNLTPEDQGLATYEIHFGKRWRDFLSGWNEEREKYMNKRRLEVKADDFLKEFKQLCEKYNAHPWFGGGDCDCGIEIEDYQFFLI
jgi:hypothetical protein